MIDYNKDIKELLKNVSVEEAWDFFVNKQWHNYEVPDEQKPLCKYYFYVGAMAMYRLIFEGCVDPLTGFNFQKINVLRRELEEFHMLVMQGMIKPDKEDEGDKTVH